MKRNKRKFRKALKTKVGKTKVRNSFTINRTLVPNNLDINLKVCESDNYQCSAGSFATFYVANGLYNPGATNWNAQPVGFDQWTSFYTKYRVLSASITLEAINNSDNTVNGIWMVVYPSVVSTTLTGGLASAICQPYARKAYMGNISGINKCTLSNSCACVKVFGESPFRDENFAGDFGTNPAFKFYWCVNVYSVGSDQANVSVIVTMSFKTQFYARVPISLSTPSLLNAPDIFSTYVEPHKRILPSRLINNSGGQVLLHDDEEKELTEKK